MKFDPKAASVPELFGVYRSVLRELRGRKIIRTSNAPAGDYAEFLVASALGGTLAPNSEKGYDLMMADGTRIQIKCRVADETGNNPTTQLSAFRSFSFDFAGIVLFNSDYTVNRAVLVPKDHVQALAMQSKHVNGYIVHAKSPLLDHPANKDITGDLRKAAGEMPGQGESETHRSVD